MAGSPRWLRKVHAATALLLVPLFFFFALAAAASLLWLGAEVLQGTVHHLRGRSLFFGFILGITLIGGALVVAWSLLPRFKKFVPPGPELHRDQHPALFREIDRVAAMTGEAAPSHVYLLAEVNAFVSERGGFAGLGARRIMGLGLPLLSSLSVSELRAVLAHEFGHYAGGDVGFGRWIHQARLALVETNANMVASRNAVAEINVAALVLAVIHAPFRWYLLGFLRFTQALSRGQELDADALAVKLEGVEPLTSGLKKVRTTAIAFSAYLEHELGPLLSDGLLPPVGAGFAQFLAADEVREQLAKLPPETQDPYDSHPPLEVRVAHAEALNAARRATEPRAAIELVSELPLMELALLNHATGKSLSRIAWSEAGARFLEKLRGWARKLNAAGSAFELQALPTGDAALKALCVEILGEDARAASADDVRGWARSFAANLLTLAHVDAGSPLLCEPGRPIAVLRDGERLVPLQLVDAYLAGTLGPEAWLAALPASG